MNPTPKSPDQDKALSDAAKRQKAQSEQALDNVRKDYDEPMHPDKPLPTGTTHGSGGSSGTDSKSR
jgi:hypothetical protein